MILSTEEFRMLLQTIFTTAEYKNLPDVIKSIVVDYSKKEAFLSKETKRTEEKKGRATYIGKKHEYYAIVDNVKTLLPLNPRFGKLITVTYNQHFIFADYSVPKEVTFSKYHPITKEYKDLYKYELKKGDSSLNALGLDSSIWITTEKLLIRYDIKSNTLFEHPFKIDGGFNINNKEEVLIERKGVFNIYNGKTDDLTLISSVGKYRDHDIVNFNEKYILIVSRKNNQYTLIRRYDDNSAINLGSNKHLDHDNVMIGDYLIVSSEGNNLMFDLRKIDAIDVTLPSGRLKYLNNNYILIDGDVYKFVEGKLLLYYRTDPNVIKIALIIEALI